MRFELASLIKLIATTLLAITATSAARGQTAQLAVLIDGGRVSGELLTINANEIRLQTEEPDEPRIETIATRDLLKWGRPVEPAPRPLVVLRGGSRLVAAPTWTRDGPLQFAAEKLIVRQALLDEVQLPRDAVRTVLFEAARDPRLFAAAIEQATTGSGPDDRIWLTNSDQFAGELASIGSKQLQLRVDGESIEFELSRVACLRLADDRDRPKPTAAMAIGLSDGGILLAESVMLGDDDQLAVKLPGGLTLSGRKPAAIRCLQPLTGRVTYLSDLRPINYRHTPYFDLAWEYRRDENLLGEPLQSSRQRWLKGLAVHSASRLVYAVPAGAQRLECELAIDAAAESREGNVIVRALVARGGKFSPVYNSPAIMSGAPARPMSVDVAGAQAVALVVEYGENGDAGDHALLLDARFIQ